jgi:Zn finger protein HypA/HybF involved in hydrogenase expression
VIRIAVVGTDRSVHLSKGSLMANPVPAGSDVSAGTYKCTSCGYELQVGSTNNLPPCPSCHNGQYDTLSGGDAAADPYPDRSG